MVTLPLLVVVLLLLLAGFVLLWWSRRKLAATGLPTGAVVYSDTGIEQAVVEPLVSYRYGLVGKPDYLVEVEGKGRRFTVPLEVKSRRLPPAPAASHVLQLAAYCLIVEDLYGQRPPHGYLRYADATLTIQFTDNLRTQVLDAAAAIRRARSAEMIMRSHQEPIRCQRCGYRPGCGSEALA